MNSNSEVEHIIKYLLEQLSPAEQEAMEDRYLTDQAHFELMCAIEDDLIEDYLAGALPETLRRQFERVYRGSPERFRRLTVASDLRETLKIDRLDQATSTTLPAQTPVQEPRVPGFRSFILSPGMARDADEELQTVVPDPEALQIVLELDLNVSTGFNAYAATLSSIEGATLYSKDGLNATLDESGSRVQFPLPAEILQPGNYIAALRGASSGKTEFIDSYYFRVTHGEER